MENIIRHLFARIMFSASWTSVK